MAAPWDQHRYNCIMLTLHRRNMPPELRHYIATFLWCPDGGPHDDSVSYVEFSITRNPLSPDEIGALELTEDDLNANGRRAKLQLLRSATLSSSFTLRDSVTRLADRFYEWTYFLSIVKSIATEEVWPVMWNTETRVRLHGTFVSMADIQRYIQHHPNNHFADVTGIQRGLKTNPKFIRDLLDNFVTEHETDRAQSEYVNYAGNIMWQEEINASISRFYSSRPGEPPSIHRQRPLTYHQRRSYIMNAYPESIDRHNVIDWQIAIRDTMENYERVADPIDSIDTSDTWRFLMTSFLAKPSTWPMHPNDFLPRLGHLFPRLATGIAKLMTLTYEPSPTHHDIRAFRLQPFDSDVDPNDPIVITINDMVSAHQRKRRRSN